MIYLVVGTSNSGKSVLAEELSMKTGDPCRIYLATMKIYDDAGIERVKKHRKQREGKGFVTLEQEYNILEALNKIEKPEETTVLLECVSNLVGNEMYENPERSEYAVSISADIKHLADTVNNLIIVTNEYEKDGEGYDDATRQYVQTLSSVNERIREFSDKIYDLRKERRT